MCHRGQRGDGKSLPFQPRRGRFFRFILAREVELETITLPARAAKKFKEFAKEEGNENYALRFGDTTGGCSGFQYILDFSEKAEESDVIYHSEGVEIHIKKGMLGRLLGC